MRKTLVLMLIVLGAIAFSLSFVNASGIDSEIQKLTKHAEDFETGNIDYVKLLVYSSAVREQINGALGVTNREMGGLLEEEQLESALGKPTERTRWAWSESEEKEIKLGKEVPAWRKIVFDGKKIQIWITSWPSMIKSQGNESLVYRLNFDINFKAPQEELNLQSRISEIKVLAEAFNKEPTKKNAETLAEESVNVEKMFERSMRQSSVMCEEVMKNIFGAENRRESQKMFVQEFVFYEGENFEVKARVDMCDDCEWKWINLDMHLEGRGPGFKMPKESGGEYSSEQFKELDSNGYKQQISSILKEMKSSVEQGDYGKVNSLSSKLRAVNEAWNQKSNDVWQEVEKRFKPYEQMTSEEQGKLEDYWWIKQEQQKREKVKEIVDKNYQERKEIYSELFSGYEKKESYFEQVEYEKRLVEEFKESGKEMCNNNVDDNKNQKVDCADEQCLGQICGKQKVNTQRGNETIEEEREMFCIAGTCQLKEEGVVENKTICGNHICELGESESCAMDCAQCPSYEAINCTGKVMFKGIDVKGCSLEPICLNETDFCQKDEECLQPLCGKAECKENKCQVVKLEECREAECSDRDEKTQECANGEKIVEKICQEGVWKETGVKCEFVLEKNESSKQDVVSENKTEEKSDKEEVECSVKEECGNADDVCSNGKCVTIPKVIEQPKEDKIGESDEEKEDSEEKEESSNEGSNKEGESESQEKSEGTSSDKGENGDNEEKTSEDSEKSSGSEQKDEGGESEKETESSGVTGNVISFVKGISGKVTGFVIGLTGFDTEGSEGKNQESGENSNEEKSGGTSSDKEESGDSEEKTSEGNEEKEGSNGKGESENQEKSDESDKETDRREDKDDRKKEDRERKQDDRERRENEERERREVECKDNCNRECKDKLISSCVGECVRKSDCKGENCVDAEIVKCEASCKEEKGFGQCLTSCQDKCKSGERVEIEREEEEHKEEKGVFKAGGTCREVEGSQKKEAYIYFDGWGEPFKQIQPLKQKYYSGGNADWCKTELESLLKQRKELEKGFNQEFVAWFFEKYLANSADEWEQHMSGIFELYWKDVDLSRQIAEKMNCLDLSETPEYNLINVKYETDYGKVEIWEELKNVKLPGLEGEKQIVSPYMKVWVFPPKEFIVYEMKKAMKEHKFPGPPEKEAERQNEEGLSAEEKELIKQDKKFMAQITKLSEKYGGNVDVAIKFVDNETVVFNLYAQVNEKDIMKVEPMLPEEMPETDIAIEIEFQKLYDIISVQEKEMQGERIESPPWDKKARPVQKVKEVVNGVKVYFKVKEMFNSAKISPETSEKDAKALMKSVFSMMLKGDKGVDRESKDREKFGEDPGSGKDGKESEKGLKN